jgi:GTP cyclohydrolase II
MQGSDPIAGPKIGPITGPATGAGDPTSLAAISLAGVERAVAELRRGGLVGLFDGDEAILVLSAEMAEEPALAVLQAASGAPDGLHMILTAERALRLGLPAETGQTYRLLRLPANIGSETIRKMADPTAPNIDARSLGIAPSGNIEPSLCLASIETSKTARLLPALMLVPLPLASLSRWVDAPFRLDARAYAQWRRAAASSLRRVGSARVPLEGAEQTEIIAFRPADGGKEHLAIVIGRPDPSQPVLTRLHSECLTGDLLGSLRCDCGQQLRGAIGAIAKAGSGVLLYMAQEGRGIGLVNKLRAYRLQDEGADTAEANLQLGFGADERLYQPAAEMLRQLGIGTVRLLTNNPDKVRGLAQCGIEVIDRVPHVFPSTGHNERYLTAKAQRLGHVF